MWMWSLRCKRNLFSTRWLCRKYHGVIRLTWRWQKVSHLTPRILFKPTQQTALYENGWRCVGTLKTSLQICSSEALMFLWSTKSLRFDLLHWSMINQTSLSENGLALCGQHFVVSWHLYVLKPTFFLSKLKYLVGFKIKCAICAITIHIHISIKLF